MKQRELKYRIFHIVIIVYLIAAFTWWAILLFQKTHEIYELQLALGNYLPEMDLDALKNEYQQQRKMIIGEGLVFGVTILFSLLLINRAFWSEINANKKLNNFLLSVTHELKTPIASINLINQTLLKKDLDKKKYTDLLKTSLEESNRLESLVNNILTVAQLDQSYSYNFEEIDMSELVFSRVNRFLKHQQNRTIRTDIPQEVLIDGDREALVKLIDNLLDNALKYSPIESPIEVRIQDLGNKIFLTISDLGAGISKNEKKKIFDKFYRVGNEDTRETKGTGLGLFIVHEIISAHKGILRLKNNQPTGTIFEIYLPKKQK